MSEPPLRYETRIGRDMVPGLPDLARLRAAVFRDWPYLYDGADRSGTEEGYAASYVGCPRAAVVFACAGDAAVGATTCLPLADETPNVQAPFLERGWDPARFFYFGESVLLPAWRGRGIGVRFFEMREAHARAVSSADFACFCAVDRPPDHPARPRDAVPLDRFWRNRGYAPCPGLACTMSWKEVGQDRATEHSLLFWMKSLRGAPLP